MKKTKQSLGFLILSALCLNSCVNNRIAIYSDNRYKPIEKVKTTDYKSPQERRAQDKNTALGISISGGGSRAQYFGLGVLIGLDELKNENTIFLNEIDYFSTVSGGGFAAGYYLTLKKNGVLNGTSFLDFWRSDQRKNDLQEFLFMSARTSSVFKLPRYERNKVRKSYPYMIDDELLQNGKNYPTKRDTINRLFLSDFFISTLSTEKVTMPMFVANATIYNNGERLPFMPHIIEGLKIKNSLFPDNDIFTINKGYGLPLSYAISGSAAFPGVLPMLKFSLENTDSVIRVIDGGAVDNLGFTTLFELLNSDTLDSMCKRALIVDCGGFGSEIQRQDNKRVRVVKLLKKALMYTVDINLLNSEENIKYLANYYDISEGNIERIGFSTIKEKFIELESQADENAKNELNQLKIRIKRKKMNWEDVYRDLAKSSVFNAVNVNTLSEISSDKFKDFTMKQVFELFELASQVDTKIKIYPWEREVLVLAGRYAVYLKQNEIRELLGDK